MAKTHAPFCTLGARLVLLAAALLLSGCLPTSPEKGDTYQRLVPDGQGPASSSEAFPIRGKGKSVAIVTTESTERQLQFMKAYLEKVKTDPRFRTHYRPDVEEVSNSRYLFNSAIGLLKDRFSRVAAAANLRQAQGYDYVAVVDFKATLPQPFAAQFVYEFNIDILDSKLQKVGVLRGMGQEPFSSGCYGWGDAVIDCGINTNITAMRKTIANLTSDVSRKIR